MKYDTYQRIVSYVRAYMNKKNVKRWSYTDYYVHPDWDGGGMSFTIQWDGDEVLQRNIQNDIENYFYGITTRTTWGNWDNQIYIRVDERACH